MLSDNYVILMITIKNKMNIEWWVSLYEIIPKCTVRTNKHNEDTTQACQIQLRRTATAILLKTKIKLHRLCPINL